MIQVVLVEPEIPPNTGNIIRLCANTGATLHLIKPLGFPLDDARMKRAGLDYHEYAQMKVHESWQDFLDREQPEKVSAFCVHCRPAASCGSRLPAGGGDMEPVGKPYLSAHLFYQDR